MLSHRAPCAVFFRLLRFDSRGHGGTQATAGDYTFEMLIADVIGLWDALDIGQSHLVGLGIGGATALGLAIDHSDRLLSLVPCRMVEKRSRSRGYRIRTIQCCQCSRLLTVIRDAAALMLAV